MVQSMGRLLTVWLCLGWTLPALAQAETLQVTLLETVNLPWQDPEVIVSASEPLADVTVTVETGGRSLSERWQTLEPGRSRSLLWSASAGDHRAQVRVVGTMAGEPFDYRLDGVVMVRDPLVVEFGAADVDLERRRLRFTANAPVQAVELSLYDVDGRLMHEALTAIEGNASGPTLSLPETPRYIARIALRVFASDDTWADVSWSPIQVELIPPELSFDPAGSGIVSADRVKLDALIAEARTLAKEHAGVHGLKFYVLGASDDAAAKGLMERRAQAVARYVKRKGVHLPVTVGSVIDPGFQGLEYIISTRDPATTSWQPVR